MKAIKKTIEAVKSLFMSKIDYLKKDLDEIDKKIHHYKSIQIKEFITQNNNT